MQDDALIFVVEQARRGDTRAFDILVRQFQNMAVAYARTLLRDQAFAEDAAQDAFVQAWRDLPRLSEPAAFATWLRRIVFKYCDRVRRSTHVTLPLDDMLPLSSEHEPAFVVEQADEAARVRVAVDALPCSLREITLLYYMTGRDVRETASFLDLPQSTVKNRLNAARKRLRKELSMMAETVYEQDKPSKNEVFAGDVLARVLREFHRQEAADPHMVNRGLLDEGRTALFQMLASDANLDALNIRDGFTLLWRKQDWQALAALLMRYLAKPLSDSETAWAYLHLANAVAMGGSAAGAVLAHEAFERWLVGKLPSLSVQWPFYPVNVGVEEIIVIGREVQMLFLAQSAEFSTSYLGVWRNNDYLAKVDAVLAEIPVTSSNRHIRFYVLRMAVNACEAVRDFDRAQHYIQQMHTLAFGVDDLSLKAELRAKALGHEINLARRKDDQAAFEVSANALTELLNSAEKSGVGGRWVRSERHNFACDLVDSSRHEMALPLWEANASRGGQVGGWGWLMYAATIWHLTQDREQTLPLLRNARAHDDREMTIMFKECKDFADIREDPEFLEAIGRR